MTLIPKPEKDITTKLQTNVPYEYRYKIPQQNTEGEKKKKKSQDWNKIRILILEFFPPFQLFSTLTSQIKSSEKVLNWSGMGPGHWCFSKACQVKN